MSPFPLDGNDNMFFQGFSSIWCFFYVLSSALLSCHHPFLIFPVANCLCCILLFLTQPVTATASSADIFLRGHPKHTQPSFQCYALFSLGSFSDIYFSFFWSVTPNQCKMTVMLKNYLILESEPFQDKNEIRQKTAWGPRSQSRPRA